MWAKGGLIVPSEHNPTAQELERAIAAELKTNDQLMDAIAVQTAHLLKNPDNEADWETLRRIEGAIADSQAVIDKLTIRKLEKVRNNAGKRLEKKS